MIDFSTLEDTQLVKAINTRWNSGASMWDEMRKWSQINRKYWKNEWEDHHRNARKVSRVKDNRIFLSVEHDISILTSRPAKPVVLPANESPDSLQVSNDLQHIFLDLYRKRQVKKKLKKGIRNLHFDRLICLHPFWNNELNDVDVRVVDPKNLRIPKEANNEEESGWIIEEINEPISKMLTRFPGKEEDIKTDSGQSNLQIQEQDVNATYRVFWSNELVAYIYKQKVLKKLPNPTWDWQGLVITPEEEGLLQQLKGRARRSKLQQIKSDQPNRTMEVANEETGETELVPKESTYFYNHFDRPRKPYIFGTVFEDGDGPFGKTDLITQAAPLQDNVNRRKRQIDDNAEEANGIFLFDLNVFNKADVEKWSGRAGSKLYGKNITQGFKRDAATSLPEYIFSDMEHSTREIDNIFATQGIVRGEKEGAETASGRAMLREASLGRREEAIDLIDFVTWELYNWWFQLMKLNYTEVHYTKPFGFERAFKVIELMQDDLEDGIDIKVIPGQVVPEDKIFKQERAKEEVVDGLLSLLDYFRETGRENPEDLYKRAVMFKLNPLSLIQMSEEEINSLMMGQGASQERIGQGEGLKQIQDFLQSGQFQGLPPDQQRTVIGRVRERLSTITPR